MSYEYEKKKIRRKLVQELAKPCPEILTAYLARDPELSLYPFMLATCTIDVGITGLCDNQGAILDDKK